MDLLAQASAAKIAHREFAQSTDAVKRIGLFFFGCLRVGGCVVEWWSSPSPTPTSLWFMVLAAE